MSLAVVVTNGRSRPMAARSVFSCLTLVTTYSPTTRKLFAYGLSTTSNSRSHAISLHGPPSDETANWRLDVPLLLRVDSTQRPIITRTHYPLMCSEYVLHMTSKLAKFPPGRGVCCYRTPFTLPLHAVRSRFAYTVVKHKQIIK
jgi:hypothetical protein